MSCTFRYLIPSWGHGPGFAAIIIGLTQMTSPPWCQTDYSGSRCSVLVQIISHEGGSPWHWHWVCSPDLMWAALVVITQADTTSRLRPQGGGRPGGGKVTLITASLVWINWGCVSQSEARREATDQWEAGARLISPGHGNWCVNCEGYNYTWALSPGQRTGTVWRTNCRWKKWSQNSDPRANWFSDNRLQGDVIHELSLSISWEPWQRIFFYHYQISVSGDQTPTVCVSIRGGDHVPDVRSLSRDRWENQ